MFDRDQRNVSGCGLSGLMSASRERVGGTVIIDSMCNMRDRGNGLGSGFAAYGIYPDFPDHFALHLMYDFDRSREETERLLKDAFEVALTEPIPTRKVSGIANPPGFWRYFCLPGEDRLSREGVSAEDFVLRRVMEINTRIEGAFVVSSGKNMGVFKGVGFPDEIGEFFQLPQYEAWTWIGHTRFPTNTPGWWGGAHPFTILDWSVVHNGEISSYGINKRYIEMFGYHCTMQTDSEVIAYLFDLLIRRHKMPLELVPKALASEFWKNIDIMDERERALHTAIRQVYASALVNGPFAVILGHSGGMLGLSDRVKLRPMVAASRGDNLYISSEEAGIREMCPQPDKVWFPRAGELVAGTLEGEKDESDASAA
jgi:glutamate synthase domain-containing protein 1